MNKAFEKILEKLKEQARPLGIGLCPDWKYIRDINAEKILQEVSEEYNDGWIPCSERLPEIDVKTSDIVLVCGSNGFQYMAFWCDDLKWRFCECGMAKEPVLWTEIVAWQPLPEPFKERD